MWEQKIIATLNINSIRKKLDDQGTIYCGNGTAVTQNVTQTFELNIFLIEVGESSQQGAHFKPILGG